MESFIVMSPVSWETLPFVPACQKMGHLVQEKSGNIYLICPATRGEQSLFSLMEKSNRWVKSKDVSSFYDWRLVEVPYDLCPTETVDISIESYGTKENMDDLELFSEGFFFPERDSTLIVIDHHKKHIIREDWQAKYFYEKWLEEGDLELYSVPTHLLGPQGSSYEEEPESLHSVL
jgi:hypothetical protein